MNFEGKDYYNKLGVSKNASLDQIRKAYYREKFDNPYVSIWAKSDLDEAYYVLTDLDKKKQYDEYLNNKSLDSEYPSSIESVFNENDEQKFDDTFYIDKEDYKIDEDTSEKEGDFKLEQPSKEEPLELKENSEKPESKEQKLDEPIRIFPINMDKLNNKQDNKALGNNKKKLIKILGTIGSGAVVFAVTGLLTPSIALVLAGTVATSFLTNRAIKYKLDKTKKEKKITKITTPESKLIEEYNKKLDDQVYKLLSEPHNNYNLEISRLRYENQIELLNKRIEMKKSEKIKKGCITKHKLELTALNMQLETAHKRLSNINEKMENYSKEQSLSKLNKKISDKAKEIDAKESSQTLGIKKLEAKKSKLLEKRDIKANKLKLRRDRIGKVQDGVIYAYDMVRNLKNVFVPVEEIDEQLNTNFHR